MKNWRDFLSPLPGVFVSEYVGTIILVDPMREPIMVNLDTGEVSHVLILHGEPTG